MPWPPRLSRTPLAAAALAYPTPLLLLPLLVAALLLPLPPIASAASISFADGQPEYPSQPEVTSDRNALARFFLQSLIEKEGRARHPHSYAYGEEPDDWSGEALSTKRSNAVNPFKSHHQSSLKDIYPQLRYSDDRRAPDGTFDSREEDLSRMEPHIDREKMLAELLARRYPYRSLQGSNALQSAELTDDDQEARLEHLGRLGIGRQADATDLLRDLVARHRTPGASSGAYSLNKRDPFGINARGFHDDVFYRDFGSFNPMKRTARSVEPENGETEIQGRENKTHAAISNTMGTDEPLAPPKTEESFHKRSKRSTADATPKPVVRSKEEGGPSSKREERAADTNESPSATELSALPASKRRPEMDSSGFHGDTFNSGFGDFWTMKRNQGGHGQEGKFIDKRRPEMDSSGFHGDTFNGGFGDFWTMKRGAGRPGKRRPEMDSSGFHGDTFSSGFGDFYTMKRIPAGSPPWDTLSEGKRRPEMDSSGFHGDTFNGGFGDFWTMKRGQEAKRRPEMDSSGFHGDTFNSGFGDFWTMKRNAQARPLVEKRRPEMDSSGFHGDTFHGGFGDFYTMKRDGYPWRTAEGGARESYEKRRPEMDSSGFHGDTFNSGFGDFWTMKRDPSSPHARTRRDVGMMEAKRRPEMDASGFHGDTFSGGFGDFYTLKRSGGEGARWPMGRMEAKRRPEMDSSGFHGDTFNSGFGDFWTMKRGQGSQGPSYFRGAKRRPEMDSSGFHGDTFNSGFGDFWTMKRSHDMRPMFHSNKRRPEMDSSGFHGDTFNSGFGDFWTMKRSAPGTGFGRHEAEEGGSEEAEGDSRVSSPEEVADVNGGGEDRGKTSSGEKLDAGPTGGSPSTDGGNSDNKFDSTKE